MQVVPGTGRCPKCDTQVSQITAAVPVHYHDKGKRELRELLFRAICVKCGAELVALHTLSPEDFQAFEKVQHCIGDLLDYIDWPAVLWSLKGESSLPKPTP